MLQQGEAEEEKMRICNKKRNENFELKQISLLIILVMISLALTINNVKAADPGHGASSISSGTFEAGNYTFPASMFVTNYLGIGSTVPSTILFINGTFSAVNASNAQGLYQDNLANVGIGTNVPLAKLHINDSSTSGALLITNVSGSPLLL